MKKYLTILILFFSFTASAQIIYTPMSAGGYQMKYLKVDSGFALPFRDTTIGRGINRPGVLVVNTQDSILYIFNGKKWTPAYVDSTGVIGLIKNKVDSVTLSGNNLFYWSNGTGYGSQLNKLDSIYMSNDSVYTCIAGNCTFRYINSGSSALTTGLTSTGDITLVDSTLTINDTIQYTIAGKDYTQVVPSVFTINSADSGYYRKDLIYADATGLHKLVGEQDTAFGVKPKLPINSIEITTVDIYGQQIVPPTPTIITSIPNLQQVTNEGNTTTNPIFINSNSIQTPLRITSDFNRSNYLYFKNNSNGGWANTGFLFKNDVTDNSYDEWSGHWFRLMQGSTNSSMIKDGAIIMTNGIGGMKIVSDSGRITFNSGSPAYPYDPTSHPYKEMGAFETDGSFRLNNYKNNAQGDSVLSTDENGLLVMKKISTSGIDSASYHTLTVNSDTTGATLNRPNGTSDFLPLPFVKKTDTTVIKVHYPLWAFTSDSLGLRTDSMPKLEYAAAGRDTSTWDNYTLIDKQFLQDRISTVTATGITRTELQDTAAAIRSSIPAATDTTSLSNRINLKLNISDTASMLSPYAKTADVPAQFNPISGTNITLSGTYPNITFNSSGGTITGLYQKITATAAQTAFTFTLIPTDANKVGFYINGSFVSQSFYSISGNTITFTSGLQLNDVVEEQGVQ